MDMDEASLYRPEALEAHRQGTRPKPRSQWLDPSRGGRSAHGFSFYALLATAIAALVAAIFVPIDDHLYGEAVLQSSSEARATTVAFDLTFPAMGRGRLEVDQPLEIRFGDASDPAVGRITSIQPAADAGGSNAKAAAQRPVSARGAVVVDAESRHLQALEDGTRGRVRVKIGATSLFAYLVPSFATPDAAP